LSFCCYANDSQHFITHDHGSGATLLRVTTANKHDCCVGIDLYG